MLAGGAGRRLGGVDKPALVVDGRPLLDRALDALGGTVPAVVVGPARPTARPVTFTAEDPPGSGPAAALQAGVAALPDLPPDAVVGVLAADLPAVTAATLRRLTGALAGAADTDGAVLVEDAREQLLLSVWRVGALAAACSQRPSWAEASVRSLLAPLRRVAVSAADDEAADIDTPEQWERWSRG
ncbi:molybdenum cofactor guanylyltransferase [Nakamurella deserti]|uniref:molybdenum cofactor guanylyltransferase n=1 Tax=Nakamurella deserti TaxID=2164074 RepID=UPI001F0B99D4|nr:NTP transferase domain-containing protein [Nakamurella deserti]